MYIWNNVPNPLSADSWREWSDKLGKNGSIMGSSLLVVIPRSSCCLRISCCRCLSFSRSSWRRCKRSCCDLAGEDCGERGLVCQPCGNMVPPGDLCCKCVAAMKVMHLIKGARMRDWFYECFCMLAQNQWILSSVLFRRYLRIRGSNHDVVRVWWFMK